MKILIVDDNKESLYLLEKVLKKNGYETVSALNGAEALERLSGEEIDLIISDILMPVMDGFQLCKHVKGNEKLKHIPLIFYTATYTDEKDEELALKMGVDKFIRKPMEIDNFISIIPEMLKSLEGGTLKVKELTLEEDEEVFKLYNERLVKKLEHKVFELEEEIIRRKETEETLRESEEKFRVISDTANDGIIMVDNDGKISYWNKAAEKMFDYSMEEAIGKNMHELVVPANLHERFLKGFKEFRGTGHGPFIGKTVELVAIRKDGTKFPIEHSIATVKLKGKWNAVGIIRDITKRKKIEEQVHMLYRAVVQSPATVIITDTEGKIEYVNPKFEQLTGYTQEDVLGKNPRVLKSGEKTPEKYKELWKTITSGHEWRGEFHNKKKNGELYWEYASISPIRNGDGKITHFLAVKEDITERKEAEQALLDSEERFRTISDTANDGIIMVDNDGNISYWNNAAENIFGYSAEEAIGKKLHETIVPDQYREAHLKGFDKFKDSGKGPIIGETTELSAVRKDGTEFPIDISITAVKLKGLWCAIGIIRDITERQKAEEQLRVSYKMASLGRLTSGVFHEILNPVNIISSHVQLLLMDAEKGSKTEEDLKSIQEEIKRIVKISDALLRFARKGELGTEEVDINSLLEKTLSILEPDMKLDEINFVRKFDDSLQTITGNSDGLRQVFLNLITNAKDAMPEGGTITVKTRNVLSSPAGRTGREPGVQSRRAGEHIGDFVEISFADTGSGIEKDKLELIFDPFFTTKKETKGTGLGLSISYGIIEDHGGAISVKSEVGKGTTFTIDLPVKVS